MQEQHDTNQPTGRRTESAIGMYIHADVHKLGPRERGFGRRVAGYGPGIEQFHRMRLFVATCVNTRRRSERFDSGLFGQPERWAVGCAGSGHSRSVRGRPLPTKSWSVRHRAVPVSPQRVHRHPERQREAARECGLSARQPSSRCGASCRVRFVNTSRPLAPPPDLTPPRQITSTSTQHEAKCNSMENRPEHRQRSGVRPNAGPTHRGPDHARGARGRFPCDFDQGIAHPTTTAPRSSPPLTNLM